jgi:Phage terminase, small subunit
MGNHNSGRRPKPTALKILQGNPGKRRLNEDEPQPPAGPVECPAQLKGPVVEVWQELSAIALAMGTLTAADVAPFATLCELELTRRLASQEKHREGFTPFLVTTVPDPDGEVHIKITEHPAIRMERHTATALRPYYEKFGLEPVARARIHVPKSAVVSKWAGILK